MIKKKSAQCIHNRTFWRKIIAGMKRAEKREKRNPFVMLDRGTVTEFDRTIPRTSILVEPKLRIK